MSVWKVASARSNLAEVIRESREGPVVLERYGEPEAVVVSIDEFRKLVEAAEDAEDSAAFAAAIAEGGPNIPWKQVKADLGW